MTLYDSAPEKEYQEFLLG